MHSYFTNLHWSTQSSPGKLRNYDHLASLVEQFNSREVEASQLSAANTTPTPQEKQNGKALKGRSSVSANSKKSHLPPNKKSSVKPPNITSSNSSTSQESTPNVKNGKRRAESPPPVEARPQKRSKVIETEEAREPTPDMEISLSLGYTKNLNEENPLSDRLQAALEKLWENHLQADLGQVVIKAQRGAISLPLVVVLEDQAKSTKFNDNSGDVLLNLFPVEPRGGPESYVLSPRNHDLLRACIELTAANRISMSTTLVIESPQGALGDPMPHVQDGEVVLWLNIVVKVSLLDAIYEEETASMIIRDAQRRLMIDMFPLPSSAQFVKPTVTKFISSLKPAPDLPTQISTNNIQPRDLIAQLLPFQARSVFWMLQQEGFTIDTKTGKVVPLHDETRMPLCWERVVVKSDGSTRFLNRLTGTLLKELEDIASCVQGGILAEEVGCGKTVECIALILLNRPQKRGPKNILWNEVSQISLREVQTTLIVTPTTLIQQWIEELNKHAPSLKVFVFEGWKFMSKSMGSKKPRKKKKRFEQGEFAILEEEEDLVSIEDWAKHCQKFDVVITTYPTLTHELNVAKGTLARPRRDGVEYLGRTPPRSPLVLVEFYRVIMDEVQLSGGTNTVEMVSLIPRVNSFAVSGTPAKSSVEDLLHVLAFLRTPYPPISQRMWKRLIAPAYYDTFMSLFGTNLAVRTCKAQVTHEFQLPKQTRFIVPIGFGRVEKTVYDDALETALDALHVDARGVAAFSGWQLDVGLLRTWLHRLRQICTHPQVGGLNKIDRIIGSHEIKSMEEVLDAMREQSQTQLVADQRKKLSTRIRKGQLLGSRSDVGEDAYRDILSIYLTALTTALEMVEECEVEIQRHREDGQRLKQEAVIAKEKRAQKLKELEKEEKTHASSAAKGGRKGKGRADSPDTNSASDTEDSDNEEDSAGRLKDKDWKWWIKTEKGRSWMARMNVFINRKREIQVICHKVRLLLGDVYLALKDEFHEKRYYDEAEANRALLLNAKEKAAVKAMELLPSELAHVMNNSPEELEPTLENLFIEDPDRPGIRTERIFEAEKEVIEVLNDQTEALFEWRSHIVSLLTMKLIEDAQEGDELSPYERALETQRECEDYMMAFQSLLADRKEALIAERTLLAIAERRNKGARMTKTAVNAAIDAAAMDTGPKEPRPQDSGTLADLDLKRREWTLKLGGRALKTFLGQLDQIILDPELAKMAIGKAEITIAKTEMRRLRNIISVQSKQMELLDKQLAPIRKVFNSRVQYFRQLQEINDTVVPISWTEDSLEAAILNCEQEFGEIERSVNARQARQRYLDRMRNPEEEEEEEEQICVLCKCEFDKGLMLSCVHHFCEDCIVLWMAKSSNKFCPVCRSPIEKEAMQRIYLGQPVPDKMSKVEELLHRQSKQEIKYNLLPEETRLRIENVDVVSERHGSKITFLVKHLLWLQTEDPGSKAVVFSAWADSLSIISDAFLLNGIRFLRFDGTNKKTNIIQDFEKNPLTQVLLLNGERENSGLNVTCACRVFLIEPTVNHAFEIQAIARVDRMGQTRETEVYCYAIENSVETNILDLGARRGLSIFTEDKARLAVDVNKLNEGKVKIDAPRKMKRAGDFIASADDMLEIMFPHLFDEYKEDGDANEASQDLVVEDVEMASSPVISSRAWGDAQEGPSSSQI